MARHAAREEQSEMTQTTRRRFLAVPAAAAAAVAVPGLAGVDAQAPAAPGEESALARRQAAREAGRCSAAS